MSTSTAETDRPTPFIMSKDLGRPLDTKTFAIPNTNADGLAAIPLTDEQKYQFDNQGWIVVPSVLGAAEVDEMRTFCQQLSKDPESIPLHERSPAGGPLQQLTDHPVILGFMNEFVAYPPLASPECYGFRMEMTSLHVRESGVGRFGAHNGSGMMRFPGDTHIYRTFPGAAHSGLTCVVWELSDIDPGDGGTLFVSGSHKSAFTAPASLQDPESPLWQTYSCPAGSLLIFSEATTHSGVPWTNAQLDRVAIFTRYNTVCSKWHKWEPHPELLAAMPAKRQTLYRPVYCQDNVV